MQIAIVDDQVVWHAHVQQYLKKYWSERDINVDVFYDGAEFDYQKEYDVIFLDIEMEKVDGFETARRYRECYKNVIIIFLTTHMELSNSGYKVNAFRYIDKGNMEAEMKEALKAIDNLQTRNHLVVFHVPNVGDISIPIKDVFFIETDKRNVIVHTSKQDIYSSRKIDELEAELTELGMFRCHKSYLVNLDNIISFDDDNVYFKGGHIAMVSSRRRQELKQKYLQQKFKMANS